MIGSNFRAAPVTPMSSTKLTTRRGSKPARISFTEQSHDARAEFFALPNFFAFFVLLCGYSA
jgi:hypothetical protein